MKNYYQLYPINGISGLQSQTKNSHKVQSGEYFDIIIRS